MYDLVWVARTPGLDLNRTLIRRLAVLKSWVDLNGLHTDHAGWSAPLPNARPFDVDRWLTPRRASDFDDEAIGLLTVPPPTLVISDEICLSYTCGSAISMTTNAPWLRDGRRTATSCCAS